MDREPVGAVFERIFLRDCSARKLPVLADEEQPDAEPLAQRGAEDEAPRLDRGDEIGLLLDRASEPLDRRREAAPVEQQGGDVAELDAQASESPE
jgi:hypothetical protein